LLIRIYSTLRYPMGSAARADNRGRQRCPKGVSALGIHGVSTSSCCGGCRWLDHGNPNEGGVYNLRLYRRKLYPSYICSRVYSRGCYDIEYSFHLRGGRPGVILSTIQGYIIMPPLAADLARLCHEAPRTAQRGLRSRPRRALFLLS